MKAIMSLALCTLIASCSSFNQKLLTENAVNDTQSTSTRIPSSNISDSSILEYQVAKRDTLMSIAYHLFGHYKYWEELKAMNAEQIGPNNLIRPRQILVYKPPVNVPEKPEGRAYLIKKDDTLGIIADKVYGDKKKWKIIWENNKYLIQDPNQIYAGLVIFYPSHKSIAKNNRIPFRADEAEGYLF